jgi:hypothetical protein
VPWDIAFTLDEIDATAFSIIFGEFEGGEFDWRLWEWKKREGT